MSKEPFLRNYQRDAVDQLHNGSILAAGVGAGKSRMGLYYYFEENGGSYDNHGNYHKMKNPQDLYIITTAMKRDSKEWDQELSYYRLTTDPELNLYDNKIVVDSWNNIKKYTNISGAFFIFDEDKVTGSGAWVKAFYKITKKNNWIILSATPGDSYIQYVPVLVANGFFKNKSEFEREHVRWSRYTSWPQIEGYYNTDKLDKLISSILVDAVIERDTIPHHEDIYCNYDISLYKEVMKNRWHPYKDEPIQQASVLCYVLRQIVNSSESRVCALLELLEKHPRAIIFYNFDYERELILYVLSEYVLDDEAFDIAEWSGHAHDELPTSNKWVFLVNYNAGAEGWNCITTDTIIFYSQNYSYKIMQQAEGRINRMNTPFIDLYYYHLKSRSGIDLAISKALTQKKNFNEARWIDGGKKK